MRILISEIVSLRKNKERAVPNFVIRLEAGTVEQIDKYIKRIIGFIYLNYFYGLLDNAVDFDSNSRAPKVRSVVDAILYQICDSENIFPSSAEDILTITFEHEKLKKCGGLIFIRNRFGLAPELLCK